MPVHRSGTYRACQAGECPVGSLFTDAVQCFTNSNVAFTSSGGYHGEGWPKGLVKLTNLYGGLPFPNTKCVGTMSGLSLFKLLDYMQPASPPLREKIPVKEADSCKLLGCKWRTTLG
jgi:2',3'-cyclic-nucleotide 2'-phosphodiesterase (5'-nucleotidase family)